MTKSSAKGLFHVHTTHSFDGVSSMGDLSLFCREKGYDFVCVTEHADRMDEPAVRSYIHDCDVHSENGVRIVPGLEYAFPHERDVHLLCVGVRKSIKCRRLEEAVGEVHNQGGLAIVAHPSRNNYHIPEEIVDRIDGIEVWNATYDSRYLPDTGSLMLWESVRRRNPRAMAYAGLDMHDVHWFREVSLELERDMPACEIDLVDELRQGRFRGQGRFISIVADKPSTIITKVSLRTGRYFLRHADRIRWAWRHKTAAKNKVGRI